jgi:hypothetical protein
MRVLCFKCGNYSSHYHKPSVSISVCMLWRKLNIVTRQKLWTLIRIEEFVFYTSSSITHPLHRKTASASKFAISLHRYKRAQTA